MNLSIYMSDTVRFFVLFPEIPIMLRVGGNHLLKFSLNVSL